LLKKDGTRGAANHSRGGPSETHRCRGDYKSSQGKIRGSGWITFKTKGRGVKARGEATLKNRGLEEELQDWEKSGL